MLLYLLLAIPFFIQGICFWVDELYFHEKRGLPRWERIGHLFDSLTVASCLACTVFLGISSASFSLFLFLSVFSCISVTKDEFVHARFASPKEHWLHAVMFQAHPLMLAAAGGMWILREWPQARDMLAKRTGFALDAALFDAHLRITFCLVLLFAAFQLLRWNLLHNPRKGNFSHAGHKSI